MSAGGRLRVSVLQGKNLSLPSGEKYFVIAQMPDGGAKTSSIKTEAANKDNISSWNKSEVVEFSKELTGEMKFLFVLMEYGRIKDKAMGEASFDCSKLISGGAHVVTTISFSPSSGGNALCEVSLDLSWDGDVPAYIAQQSIGSGGAGVTSTASGGAAAGSNGTVGGNAVVRGGGLAAQLPSPEGRSYSVRVMVRKAKNLQSENDNQLYDPLVCVSIGGETQKTDYQKKTNEPIFDDELMFMVNADAQFWSLPIKITVMHHRIGLPDDEIGGTQMEMQAVYRSNNHLMANKWFLLRRGGLSTQIMGFLKLTILVLDAMNDQIPEMEDDPEDGEESEDALIRNLVNTPGAQFEEIYLRCEMFRAQAIPQMDSFPGGLVGGNTADPFVKLTYGAKTARTSHILNTLSPKWNSAIMLPIQKPALIDSLMIQMYDYDGVGKDKLISTARLSIDEMKPLEGEQIGKSDEGLPRFYPRFVNFYGCPRSFYRDNPITSSIKPKYYQEMDKGLKEGVDFRGRLLCRFGGSRDKNCASEPITIQPKTAILHFTVVLQALQFSMLRKGKYTFQLTCGTADDQRPAAYANGKNTEDMRGDSSNLGAVFFGEEIRLDQSLEVVIPTPLVGQPTNFRSFVYNQFPDIFLHLMRDKDMYAVYRIKVSEIVGKEEAVLVCDAMRVMKDPEKNDEGEAPTDPLAQFCIGFMLKKVEKVKPEGLDKNASAAQQQQNADLELTADEIALLPTTETVRLKAISLGEPEKYALECCIHRGVNFPVGDPNGLSDPFIRISWANASAQSGVQLETLNPTYEELVLIRADARQPFTNLIVELWDWDLLGSNTFLAKAVVPQKYAAADAGEKVWLSNFTDHRGKPVEARLLCSFEFRKDVGQKYPDKIFQKKPGRNDTYRGLDIPDKKRLILSPHTITVSALSLRKMRPFRLLDVKNAQVSVAIGNTVIEFEKKKGLNPDINQTKTLVLDLPINCEFWPNLSVAVYDHRNFASKPRVGVASVPLIKLHKSEGGKQTTVENLYDPERKEAASKQQEVEVEERQKGIRRWRNEAFGDPLTIANDASISNMSPLNETGELTASYSIALRQRDADRAKREDKKSRKGRQGLDATEAAGDEEMEDSQNEEEVDEAEIALAVVQSDVEKKFVDKVDAEREKEEATKDKQVSKPSDIPWFERYDADETIEEKDFIVARLGKVHDYLCKQDRVRNYKGASEGTAEAYFGPFSDEGTRVPLLRGFTNKATKAGEITLDISIQATKGAKPTPEADKGAIVGEAIKSRQGVKFQMRAYLINCRHLAAVDHSIGGSSSDPYIVMTLNTGADGDKGAKGMKLSLVEYKKFKTLNPDYYHVQTMDGELPKQSNLLVEVFDYNDVMSDKLIGFTNINLEDRWYSCRGYQANRPYMQPGMYTEKRQLRDKSGQIQGTIELWIDMYPLTSIPHPIDITPPPPIEMELRTIIWQARDVMLEDMSLSGEPMVDIYVRAWMNGLRHDMQTTDVHYRSLDGSGTFNWRMNFQFLFDPRSKKIMPMAKKASSIAKWFRIRREQKTFDPIVKIQIFDNNLLPGTDNFIGEASLNLLKMRPVNNPRNKFSLLSEMLHDVKDVAKSFLCCKCCHRQPNIKDLSLEQRQIMAVKEFEQDCAARQKVFEEEAEERIKKLRALKGVYTEEQLANFRVKFIAEARAKAQINAFETFLPSARSKAKVGRHLKDVQELPPLTETAKYWFTARGPKGSGRVGDVQVSFQLVRLEALAKDEKLAAGKGRAEPQALPDPNRPDTSYFWLTSPFKAAAHIMWARFKWYILGLLAFLILCVFLYLFLKYGIKTESEKFFS